MSARVPARSRPKASWARNAARARASSASVGPPSWSFATSASIAASSSSAVWPGFAVAVISNLDPELARRLVGRDVLRDLVVVDEALVEPARLAGCEDAAEKVELGVARREERRSVARPRPPAGARRPPRSRAGSRPRATHRRRLAGAPARYPCGIGPKYLLDQGARRLRVDVAGDDERRVVRDVPGAEELAHVLERRRVEVAGASRWSGGGRGASAGRAPRSRTEAPGRRARSRSSGGARSSRPRAGRRTSARRRGRAGTPSGRSRATGRARGGSSGRSRSSWCGRSLVVPFTFEAPARSR